MHGIGAHGSLPWADFGVWRVCRDESQAMLTRRLYNDNDAGRPALDESWYAKKEQRLADASLQAKLPLMCALYAGPGDDLPLSRGCLRSIFCQARDLSAKTDGSSMSLLHSTPA